jgi:RimJ/RimL family protein N-acetyltransferase
MQPFESARLYYRELEPSDAEAMFELDSNPEVHKYLGKKPVTTIEQIHDVIAMIREQYRTNGVGRMAAIEKETGEFIGWAGLKLVPQLNGHENFYDVGYRFIPRYWGKGYATESAQAFVAYGFKELKLEKIVGTVLTENTGSVKALRNAGLQFVEFFDYDGEEAQWYELENPYV